MALRLTKTNKIVFAISIVLLSSVLGFLVWRVNQQESVAPGESEAISCTSNANCPDGCYCHVPTSSCTGSGGCILKTGSSCGANEFEATAFDGTAMCCHICPYTQPPPPPPSEPNCGNEPASYSYNKAPTSGIGPFPVAGEVILYYKSLLDSGYRPKITFRYNSQDYVFKMPTLDSNKRARVKTGIKVKAGDTITLVKSDDDRDQGSPMCEPGDPRYISFGWILPSGGLCGSGLPGPPTGGVQTPYEKVSITADVTWATGFGYPVVGKGSQCWADWREWPGDYDFNDYFLQISYEPEIVETQNVCEGGIWVSGYQPTGEITQTSSIPFKVRNTDPDGVGTKTAILCTGSPSVCTTGTNISTTLTGTDSNDITGELLNLQPGTYTLTVAWEDKLGGKGSACSQTTTFTVTQIPTNPAWTVTKNVVGQCIDEGTENPSAKLTYTIKVKNVGDGSGNAGLEDVLRYKGSAFPSGLQPSNVQPSGSYSSSKITWGTLSFTANQERTYTYDINVSKSYFGLYTNTVTVIVEGDDPQASASIEIDCEIAEPPPPPPEEPEPDPEQPQPEETIPETGIFDSTLGKIFSGALLLAIGVFVYTLPNKVFFFTGKPLSYKYRDRFEKKVAKK